MHAYQTMASGPYICNLVRFREADDQRPTRAKVRPNPKNHSAIQSYLPNSEMACPIVAATMKLTP